MENIAKALGLKKAATEEEILAAIIALKSDVETSAELVKGLKGELKGLKKEVKSAPVGIAEEAIAEKVRAGLTRDLAIQVLTEQAAHDATKPHDPEPKAQSGLSHSAE